MRDVIAIIPARSGSKGVPDKNIRLLAGKPLLAYSIAAARLIGTINRVIVSTDSEYYADIAREYGAETPFLRPAEFSGDRSTDYQVIRHAIDWMIDNEGYQPEFLVHLRPTTPLREISHIENAIECMWKNPDATSLRSAHEMAETAYKMFELEDGYWKCVCTGLYDIELINLSRQEFPKTYHGNGYVDVLRSSYAIEYGKIHGDRAVAYITPHVVEVDTPDDFESLEYQISKNPMLVNRLFK